MSDPSRTSTKIGTLHSFRCAQCGEPAATVDLLAPGPVAIGQGPLGDDMVIDLGDSGTYARQGWLVSMVKLVKPEMSALLAGETVDPLVLHRADSAFGRFCCTRCEQNYCSNCWTHWQVRDNISGRCRLGHEQWLDYN